MSNEQEETTNNLQITYKNVKQLLYNWNTDVKFNIEDIDYLNEYLKDEGVRVDISLLDLAKLFNRYSEEKWSAQWEDNVEGPFIQWLKEKIK